MRTADEPPAAHGSDSGETPLADRRREAFARALAGGGSQNKAYVAAGYQPSRSAASRLANSAEVAARILALRAQANRAADADLEGAIVLLIDTAAHADLASAAGLREAREARLEALRLHAELMTERGEG
ncbi:MAG TPA: hypothetical protein VGH03_15330 [Caulobacteraceae bacterium]|jgi:hypothetical protein